MKDYKIDEPTIRNYAVTKPRMTKKKLQTEDLIIAWCLIGSFIFCTAFYYWSML